MNTISIGVGKSLGMTSLLIQDTLDLFNRPTRTLSSSQLTFTPTLDSDTGVDEDFDFGRQITPFNQLPEPTQWVDRFIHTAVEILNGRRAAIQLSRWCSRKVFAYLAENARVRPGAVRIGRKKISQPFEQILEVTAMLHGKERSRVLVCRFEGLDGRWICVELFTI